MHSVMRDLQEGGWKVAGIAFEHRKFLGLYVPGSEMPPDGEVFVDGSHNPSTFFELMGAAIMLQR